MYGTSHTPIRPTRATVETAGERRTIRRPRPSRQVQQRAAFVEQGMAR